jgi:transcriptional regulator with XRE-family HTH domain
MEITPEQLLQLRKERRLTRQKLAQELGCSAGAIVQWEGRKRGIPAWVADKMYANLPLEFSIQELEEMFQVCQKLGCSMTELLQNSVRSTLNQHSKSRTKD